MARANESNFIALLAGGRGTRFWPLSRALRPKQLLDVTGEGPLLGLTLERVAELVPARNVVLVTSADIARDAARLLGMPVGQVLAEPVGRNTAPAVALALAWAVARDEDAVVLCLPADHHVARPSRLRKLLTQAARAARHLGSPVLLGIDPEGPSSDYGYVVPGEPAAGAPAAGAPGLRRVARFVEKPAKARAKELLRRGALWNSGMFVLPARATLEAIDRLLPELGAAVRELPLRSGGRRLSAALRSSWPKLPSLSFDAEVLEHMEGVHVLPAGALGWSDVGSWESLGALLPADGEGNRSKGPAFFHGSTGCLAFQSDAGRSIVMLGAKDLVVVDAGDVVFAAPRSELGRLRELVARLQRERPEMT